MNKSTSDVIEIMTLVRDQFNAVPNRYRLKQYRINALNQIAQRRSRDRNTIANAYIRELHPHISGTIQFDKYLDEWIANDSSALVDIILNFVPEWEKEETLVELQNEKSEVQKLLDCEVIDSVSQKKYPEGRKKLEIHLTKERKPQLIADAKQEWEKNQNGDVRCSVCQFSFSKTYGNYGQGFIEAHHNLPISELSEETVMKTSDLSPVCSNCHRIIHRKRPFLTVSELREIVKSNDS